MSNIVDPQFEERVQRFITCNTKMREATLESERAFLKEAGNISAAQLQVILAVGAHMPCTMTHLAKVLHFTQANVTQMVNRLIDKKFLKRTRSKDDGRVMFVTLLAKGRRVFELNQAHVERVARNWFANMTKEEQEGMLATWEKYLGDGD